jgi:hypothetical protein
MSALYRKDVDQELRRVALVFLSTGFKLPGAVPSPEWLVLKTTLTPGRLHFPRCLSQHEL